MATGGGVWVAAGALFAFACLLLYRTLLLLLRDYRGQGYAVLAAWMATLLFAAHPIHTEVVANVKGCDEIVTLLGSLGALFWTIKAFASGKAEYRFFAAGSLFLGLLAKENAVTFLAVIPLALVFFRGAGVGSIVRSGWPLLAAFAAFFAIRLTVLPELFSKPPLELLNNPYLTWAGDRWVDFTAAEKLATIVYTLGKYVQLLFAPVTLTHDYYPRHIDVKHFSDPAVLGSLAFYFLLACYALVGPSKGKRDLLRFGILFYLLSLSIVSNLMFPIGTHMGERFLFMPSVGFCLAATALLLRLSRSERGFDCRRIGLPLGLVVVAAALFSLRTISRNQDWYDNKTLFFHDVKTSANSAKLNAACGLILYQEGSLESDPAKELDLFRRALLYDDKAIQIHPTYKSAWLNRGVVNLYLKNYDAAIADSRRVLQMAPEDRKASSNLSLALCAKGKAYGETSDFPTALRLLSESYQADPSNQETIWFLGIFSGKSGDYEDAVRWHAKFTEIRPNDPAAWKGLEWAYDLAGDLAKGAECRARAAQLNQKPPQ